MLNELFALSKVLNTSNIEQKEWHKDLKILPQNSPCFRIWISKDCVIKGIEKLASEQISFLRKYEPSNGHSFPAFNCPPLWIFNKKDKEESDKKEADILADWLKEQNNEFCIQTFKEWVTDDKQKEFFNKNEKLKRENKDDFDGYIGKNQRKLESCTKKIPISFVSHIPENTESVLLRLIKIVQNENFNFQEQLKTFVLDELEKKDDYKKILEFLLESNASVVLDFKEWQELGDSFRYPVAHEKTINFINEVLLKSERKNTQKKADVSNDKKISAEKDAFGDDSDITDEKLLGPALPWLGNLKLRSMTKESPCNARYRKLESGSYPISKNNVINTKKAIEWLSSIERKGKNWTAAGAEELLFVYPSKLCEARLADMLGGSDEEDLDDTSEIVGRFEKKAEDVIKALERLSTDGEFINIELFTLKKMDKGNINTSYSRNYNAQDLINAAKDWKEGCRNIPAMDFETEIPFPLSVAKLANKFYNMDGSENKGSKKLKLKPINSYQGLNLMLERNNAEVARYILGTLQMNCYGLVKQLNKLAKVLKKRNDEKKEKKETHAYIVPLFGLLLHKLNIRKECYMENFPYLLGQKLKISDELHALWCKNVRKGDLPPQLAGNSLFVSALETPFSALAQLGPRINPYYAWAKQYRTKGKEESRLAGWFIKLYEENADKLQSVLPDKSVTFNDVEKAQLFIGYLASLSKKEKNENEISLDIFSEQGE